MELIRTPKVENVRLLDRYNSKNPSTGTLYLTATHLIFVDPDANKETWILHMLVYSVEKLALSTQGSPLLLRCKNFLTVTFVIPKERDCHDLFTSLLQLSQPSNIEDLYCFHYTASNEDLDKKVGWNGYEPIKEFHRMGVPDQYWTLTPLNSTFDICDTYPRKLFVPSRAPTQVILSSSKFRSKGRIPALTYLHKNKASLCRCSQPLSGFSARCLEDEKLLDCIFKCNPSSSHMLVVDTRPKINAIANRAAGKGYENEAFYENIKFHFAGIENIHVMRSSLNKLIETCQLVTPSMSNFLSGLESSGWLKHVRCVLETAAYVASEIARGISVLVHCSDGWDRTAQACSLAQVILDPYYRTTEGLQILIEKDWLSFGHKFTDRCGHIQSEGKEVSPIFTQFIDCVYQLTQIIPCAFEFNERYLLTLHDHVYSSQFGTFIGNCQRDRIDLRLSERTYSFWGYTAAHRSEYRNPLYKKDSTSDVLKPTLSTQNIRFWRGMYNRFDNGVHPREPIEDILTATLEHSVSVQDHIDFLRKRISWLKEEIDSAKKNPNKIIPAIDNRLLDDTGIQNGDFVPHGRLNMSLVERSLMSVGALLPNSAAKFRPTLVTGEGPCLTQTTPEKFTSEIKQIDSPICKREFQFPNTNTTTISALSSLLTSLSLDWKSLRHVKECSCSTPFDHFSRKHHCWSCGDVFCTRCIDKKTSLPGHLSQKPSPVCRRCYKGITRSLSVDTP